MPETYEEKLKRVKEYDLNERDIGKAIVNMVTDNKSTGFGIPLIINDRIIYFNFKRIPGKKEIMVKWNGD